MLAHLEGAVLLACSVSLHRGGQLCPEAAVGAEHPLARTATHSTQLLNHVTEKEGAHISQGRVDLGVARDHLG